MPGAGGRPRPSRVRACCRGGRRTPCGACCFAEDPTLSARDAAILFEARIDSSVLGCNVIDGDPEGFDLMEVGCFSALLRDDAAREHVVLGDGLRRLRLDVAGGSLLAGPVRLRFRLEGLHAIEAPLLTLRRLAGLDRLGRMPHQLYPVERRASRWIQALRAVDAEARGASQREIAEALVGSARIRSDWNAGSDYLRSQVRRLLGLGRRMVRGDWRDLLRPRLSDDP